MAKKAGKKSSKISTQGVSDGALIVMEGDSWERLPDWGLKKLPIVGGSNYDLERALTALGHDVRNLAYWGDTIEDIAGRLDFIGALKKTGASHLILGGGGNDLLSEGKLVKHLMLYLDDRKPEDYLKPSFDEVLNRVMKFYEICFDALDIHKLKPKVIVHGYDYAKPMNLGWLGEPMSFMGIDDPDLQQSIAKVMMNRFNKALKALANGRKRVTYVNLRGTVQNDWHDELHPNRKGFERVAHKIHAAL